MLGHDNYYINTATGDNGHLAYLEAYEILITVCTSAMDIWSFNPDVLMHY